MRPVLCLLMLVSYGVHAQSTPDPFEMTQRIAENGAPQLALARVEQMQPAAATAPRWTDWEQLRCVLLGRLMRSDELAKRVAALPSGVPEPAVRVCLLQGARAAIATGQAVNARNLLARLMWRQGLSADEMRQSRALVIESYLAEQQPQNAFALMLRYELDYKPVDRDTAARFVDALIAAGMEKDAVNWLAQLDDASALKLLLRLKANLITPEAVIAQSRAALAKNNSSGYWLVLQQAGARQKDSVLVVEALENLLQIDGDKPSERRTALANELWKGYAIAAQDVANQNRLLVGDDGGWGDYAARLGTASPAGGRALFAYLAQQSKTRATRQSAQLQLTYSLQNSKLPLTAIRLFGEEAPFPVADLDPQARFLLGGMASESNQPRAAARYWQGLAQPAALDVDEWRLRLASVMVRGGMAQAGADALRALLAGKKTLAADFVRRAVNVLQDFPVDESSKAADELYRAILPLAASKERREILCALARLAETRNDFRGAADYFMEAALLSDGKAPDLPAIDARIAAASNLARAGFKDDARVQFESLRKNVRDADKLELTRRELLKL